MSVAEYNRAVPENIERLIKARGLKQGFIAKRAGFSKQQFCDMLNGRRIIKPCDAMAIAEALEVSVADLFADTGQRRA